MFEIGFPGSPLMVLVTLPWKPVACVAVTLEMVILRIVPAGGWPAQLPLAPTLIQIGAVVPDIVMLLYVTPSMTAPSLEVMPIPAFPAAVIVMVSKLTLVKSPQVSDPNCVALFWVERM